MVGVHDHTSGLIFLTQGCKQQMTGDGKFRRTRRSVLAAFGGGVAAGLAGCSGGGEGDTGGRKTGDGGDGEGLGLGGTETVTSSPSGADGGMPWMTSYANPELTRSTPDALPETLEQVGSVGFDGRADSTHPLVTGDRLVASLEEMTEVSLVGVDLQSRERAFTRSLTPEFGGFVRDGTLVIATIDNVLGLNLAGGERQWIVGETGLVFPVPGGVGVATGGTGVASADTLRVVDPDTGDRRWDRSYADEGGIGTLNERSRLPVTGGTPTLRNSLQSLHVPVHRDSETVYVGAGQTVDALDARTGDRRWRFTREDDDGRAATSPSPAPFAVHGDTVYLEVDGGLLALDRTDGTRRWERTDRRVASVFTYAVDGEGLYYFNSREAEAVALDPADGTELWSTPFQTSGSPRAKLSPVAASNGVVFAPNQQLRVLSKANGESQRSVDVEAPRSVAVVGGRIYVLHGSTRASLSIYGPG